MTATAAPQRAWRTGEEAPRRTGEEAPRRTGEAGSRRTGEAPRRTGETAARRTGKVAPRRAGETAPRRAGKESPRRGEEAPRRTGKEAPRRIGKEAPRRTGETGGGGASLEESRSFGLSSRSLGGNVSVFQVKLTDSAARAIRSFQELKGCSSHPTISFNGSKGRIVVPCSENNELSIFTFGVTNVARDNPHGSFDCFHQRGSTHLSSGPAHPPSGSAHLSCVGSVQRKLTINATDDSYAAARQSLAAAEEETRRHAAIAIKHGGRFQGRKVTVRVPAPALAGLTRPRPSSRSALSSVRRGVQGGVAKPKGGVAKPKASGANRKCAADVQQLPLRQRVSHLLALRAYQRPELLLRLQRDGLTDQDRDQLDLVLMEVGQPGRNNTFTLKDDVYQELQKNWPGYTSGDQQLLKRVFVRKLFRPQQDHLRIPEAQVSPLRETPTSSPRRVQDYTDPLASKKPRISLCRPRPGPDRTRNSLDPRQLFESLAAVERLEPTSCPQQESDATAPPSSLLAHGDRPPSSPLAHGDGPPSSLLAHRDRPPSSPLAHSDGPPSSPLAHGDKPPSSPLDHRDGLPSSPLVHSDRPPSSPQALHDEPPSSPLDHRDGPPSSLLAHRDKPPSSPLVHSDRPPSSPQALHDEPPSSPLAHGDGPAAHGDRPPSSPLAHGDGPAAHGDRPPSSPLAHGDGPPSSPLAHRDRPPFSPLAHREELPSSPLAHHDELPSSPLAHREELPSSPLVHGDRPPVHGDRPPSSPLVHGDRPPSSPLAHGDRPPSLTRRKRRKHRDQEIRDLKSSDQSVLDTSEKFDSEFRAETDFLLKYSVICSPDQRLRYKQDFNTEYSEYRSLHARIDGVTRQFMELDAKLRRLHHQSHKHKQVRNQILLEYRKIKKSNPNYSQNKSRCEYLHNKLSHIKRLISQYDQQQL